MGKGEPKLELVIDLSAINKFQGKTLQVGNDKFFTLDHSCENCPIKLWLSRQNLGPFLENKVI